MKRLTVSAGLLLAFFYFTPESLGKNPFNLRVKGESVSCKMLVSHGLGESHYWEAIKRLIFDSETLDPQYKVMNSHEAQKRMPLLTDLPGYHWMYRKTPTGSRVVVSTHYSNGENEEKTVGLTIHFRGGVDSSFLDQLREGLTERFDFLLNGGIYTSARTDEIDPQAYMKVLNQQDYLEGNTWHFEFDPMTFYFLDNRMNMMRADLSPEFLNEILEEVFELTESLPLEQQQPSKSVRQRSVQRPKAAAEPEVVTPVKEAPEDITSRPPSPELSGPDLQQYELLRQAIISGMKNGMKERANEENERIRRRRLTFPVGDGRGTGH